MNIAIILAGGVGTRIESSTPKQYIEVKGKPIICYCLDVFEQCDKIDSIQIVADQKWHDLILHWRGTKFRGFSEPGRNRQLSIYHALRDIRHDVKAQDIVIIHDAARPLVTEKLLTTCITACAQHEGAVPALSMKDTVYFGESNKIESLLSREKIYAGQAPEAFIFEKYMEANERLLPDQIESISGSAEPAVLAGMDVALVTGDERNFKITTREDLERFCMMMEE